MCPDLDTCISTMTNFSRKILCVSLYVYASYVKALGGSRTLNLSITNAALCQLSYAGFGKKHGGMITDLPKMSIVAPTEETNPAASNQAAHSVEHVSRLTLDAVMPNSPSRKNKITLPLCCYTRKLYQISNAKKLFDDSKATEFFVTFVSFPTAFELLPRGVLRCEKLFLRCWYRSTMRKPLNDPLFEPTQPQRP